MKRRQTDTSREAHESIQDYLARMEGVVYGAIHADPRGMTCWEVEQQTKMIHQTASARIAEMRDRKLLRDTGARRPTGTGRNAIVWMTAKALQARQDVGQAAD